VAKLLLEHGASSESKDAQGARPIHKAIQLDLSATLKRILAKKVDVTATTNSGHTPLELAMPRDSKLRQKTATGLWRNWEVSATTQEYTPCLKILLDSLSESDINRGEMLFEATKDGRPDIVQLLLKKGARPSVQSNQRTPLH
jgi:ankyrin repeat protein